MQLYNNELIAYTRIQINDETFDSILVQINGIHEQYFGYGFQNFQAKFFSNKKNLLLTRISFILRTFNEDFFHITNYYNNCQNEHGLNFGSVTLILNTNRFSRW